MQIETLPHRISQAETLRVSRHISFSRVPLVLIYGMPLILIAIGVPAFVQRQQTIPLAAGAVALLLYALIELWMRVRVRGAIGESNARSHVATFGDTIIEFRSEEDRLSRMQYADFKLVEEAKQSLIMYPKTGGAAFIPLRAFKTEDQWRAVVDQFRAEGVKVYGEKKRKL